MIAFDKVTKVYPSTTRPALDSVSLNIERGEFVFLVGPSGSGKSTMLRLVLREDVASTGTVSVAGRDVSKLSAWKVPALRRQIGTVFQDFRLLPNKTVFENVAFALEVLGKSSSMIAQEVPRGIRMVGLQGKERRLPRELSGGEQQRVAIARAFVNRPAILLADEPTGNLDPASTMDVMNLLQRIAKTGTTIVMATHNDEIVNTLRKRVIELDAGRIVRDVAEGGYFPTAEEAARRVVKPAERTDLDDTAVFAVENRGRTDAAAISGGRRRSRFRRAEPVVAADPDLAEETAATDDDSAELAAREPEPTRRLALGRHSRSGRDS